ncbi:MAG: sensor domain-containing diguanylate cyclase [Bacillota bacterium]|nr:sensor domain-containing diguanylate cyclase [Bacillota bacterium]
MRDSIISALRLMYDGAYVVDFKSNSCLVYFSTFLPEKYNGNSVSLQAFLDACADSIEDNHKHKITEFISKANLRNGYIKNENPEIIYAAKTTDPTSRLFKAVLIPESAERGLICSCEIGNEIGVIADMGISGMEDFHAAVLRIKDNGPLTIEYANDFFFHSIGYSREAFNEQMNGSLGRIAIDDFIKCKDSCGSYDEKKHYDFNLRLRHRTGSTIWMHNICTYSETEKVYTAIMVNITEQVKKEHDVRAQDEMYRAILNNLNLMYFVYDVGKDEMIINISTDEGESRHKVLPDYLQNIKENKSIHPQDLKTLTTAFSRLLRKGEGKEVFEYRNSYGRDGYRWVRANMTAIKDAEGTLDRIIGRLDNIDREIYHKEEESRWKEKAERDSLTGLFGRETGIRMIKDLIEKNENTGGVLFILDVDNFKEVNDTEGHMAGDKLLKEIAEVFAAQFRNEDVVCRYGGDEMVAFIPGMSDLNVIKRKSDLILKEVRCIDRGEAVPVTCSIGISVKKPGEDVPYETMFRNADMALYSAKSHNKNCGYIFK